MVTMKHKVVISIAVFVVIVTIGGLSFALLKDRSTNKLQNNNVLAVTNEKFKSTDHGISLEYPHQLFVNELTKQDIDDRFLLRLTGVSQANQNMLVTVRYEQELNKVASAIGKSVTQALLVNLSISYPKRFPGYTEVRRQSMNHAGVDAAEVVFTYDSPTGAKVKQHLLMLARTDDEALFVSFQALESDFNQLDTEYFKPIRDSIKFE